MPRDRLLFLDIIYITMKTHPYLKAFLRHALAAQLAGGSFSARGLSLASGRSYGRSSGIASLMLSKGLARMVSPRRVLGSGRSGLMGQAPARYVLTGNGRSMLRLVLCGGTFDIIHPGHIAFLEEARAQGDVLAVVVARDSTVMKAKGVPYQDEGSRLAVIRSLRQVDAAFLGLPGGHAETIEHVMPDVVFLGYDQREDYERLRGLGKGHYELMWGHPLEGHSTSRIVSKIKGPGRNNNP
jgi:cytidyltransferase-like protein